MRLLSWLNIDFCVTEPRRSLYFYVFLLRKLFLQLNLCFWLQSTKHINGYHSLILVVTHASKEYDLQIAHGRLSRTFSFSPFPRNREFPQCYDKTSTKKKTCLNHTVVSLSMDISLQRRMIIIMLSRKRLQKYIVLCCDGPNYT